ncbi:MAG TPA: HAD-IA family hydrolase [Gemmatimonadales bacterium]
MIPGTSPRVFLFDLDGVLVDSRRSIENIWRRWAAARGRDPAPFIAVCHGRRISETIAQVAPELDAKAEAAVLDRMEEVETDGVEPVAGARDLLAGLAEGTWAVVTSGSRKVAMLRLTHVELPIPKVFITAEDVRRGKPDPEGYLLAAARLGVEPKECVVIEDSAAGIAAGIAAGMRVIQVSPNRSSSPFDGAVRVIPTISALLTVLPKVPSNSI